MSANWYRSIFFTVPTIKMRVVFVLIVLEHHRGKVLHFNVTDHPTGAWTAQQIVEAFADRTFHSVIEYIGTNEEGNRR
jgi:hypothetical protein